MMKEKMPVQATYIRMLGSEAFINHWSDEINAARRW